MREEDLLPPQDSRFMRIHLQEDADEGSDLEVSPPPKTGCDVMHAPRSYASDLPSPPHTYPTPFSPPYSSSLFSFLHSLHLFFLPSFLLSFLALKCLLSSYLYLFSSFLSLPVLLFLRLPSLSISPSYFLSLLLSHSLHLALPPSLPLSFSLSCSPPLFSPSFFLSVRLSFLPSLYLFMYLSISLSMGMIIELLFFMHIIYSYI